MTITDLPPSAIHRGEEELPFVDIGDGATLQLLQVDLANGVWIVRNHFLRTRRSRPTNTPARPGLHAKGIVVLQGVPRRCEHRRVLPL